MQTNSSHPTQRGSDCLACLHEAVEAARAAFKRMFPYHWVQGIVVPNVGSPRTHLRAWALQTGMKAEQLQRLVLDLASDLDATVAAAQVAQLGTVRAVATRLLHDLFPDASVHDPFLPFRLTRMSTFDEALQIAEAAADLARQLAAILQRCPGAGGDLGGDWVGAPLPALDVGDGGEHRP